MSVPHRDAASATCVGGDTWRRCQSMSPWSWPAGAGRHKALRARFVARPLSVDKTSDMLSPILTMSLPGAAVARASKRWMRHASFQTPARIIRYRVQDTSRLRGCCPCDKGGFTPSTLRQQVPGGAQAQRAYDARRKVELVVTRLTRKACTSVRWGHHLLETSESKGARKQQSKTSHLSTGVGRASSPSQTVSMVYMVTPNRVCISAAVTWN